MANAIDILNKAKTEYLQIRGGTPDPLRPSKMIPKTTYGDVIKFGLTLLKFVSEDSFVKTSSFLSARDKFIAAMPPMPTFPSSGFTGAAMAAMSNALVPRYELFANVVYPKNLAFWNAADNLAIARGGAGVVPGSFEIAAESVKEALQELPGRVPGLDVLGKAIRIGVFVLVGYGVWMLIGPSVMKRMKGSEA